MNRDQIEGGIRNIRGRGRSALGAVTGRARPQVEGAYEQVAGVAQSTYGRIHAQAEGLHRDGRHFADEAVSRGRSLRDEATDRSRHYRSEARRQGRALIARAEDNRGTTLALVAAAAFGLGWLVSRGR
ncbi:CsbD family protein [Methylorubrum salsuginis]|uniref:Uncharacterized conserved protein YjbJ, UPF0337 family n=1 Tax=Methylorubrum salsuginis TaxID=414703 RepID=A0A1I4A406_9HYPH|nr:CsbD family protein [Methylorubrum salsuginis]SFK51064.1 Uncharacterized conserved protein YjbJ, UPF0337 family [Methylorubrum salsuginis]